MKTRQFIYSLIAFLICSTVYLSLPRLKEAYLYLRGPGPEQRADYHLVPILCFHNLDGKGVYSISRQTFRKQLERIRAENIQVVPLRTVLEKARRGEMMKRPSIAITIDDDFPNIVRVAAPLLREFRFPATFFVYIKNISRNPREGLSWEDLRRLHAEGFDIQNHSYTHTRFHIPRRGENLLNYAGRVHRETLLSRELLERNIPGLKIYSFAYPMGYFTPDLNRQLLSQGYDLVLTTDAYPVDRSRKFTGVFHRYTIQKKKYIKNPEALFRLQLSYAKQKYKPVKMDVSRRLPVQERSTSTEGGTGPCRARPAASSLGSLGSGCAAPDAFSFNTIVQGARMEHNFWHKRWENNQIGFHESKTNYLLLKYFTELSIEQSSRVFVPLCGKTLDIAWLLSSGYNVVGAELSELAIKQLFEELSVEPEISEVGNLKHYSAKNIDIFVGNIFDLSESVLGKVDAVYDRAALVALPEEMRNTYSAHIMQITKNAPMLLICFEYDQNSMNGPPFSISGEEVNRHYKHSYNLSLIASVKIPGGFKGNLTVKESVWLLQNKLP